MMLFPYVGGKWYQLKNILPIIDSIERVFYIEPFGGAGTVLLNKSPEPHELYNDVDGRLVNVFRVIKDETKVDTLQWLCDLTPMSREFYNDFSKMLKAPKDQLQELKEKQGLFCVDDDTALAFAFFYVQTFSFGGRPFGGYATESTNHFRAPTYRKNVDLLPMFCNRLRNVNIENLDFVELIKRYDKSNDVLFYMDPPYDTKTSNAYKAEVWSVDKTKQLVEICKTLRGSCVLSCYDSELFEPLLDSGYQRVHFTANASVCSDKSKPIKRTETVYYRNMNQKQKKGLLDD